MEQLKSYGDDIEGNSGQMSSTSQPVVGPESWPLQGVFIFSAKFREMVHEAVARGCREQQRQIEVFLNKDLCFLFPLPTQGHYTTICECMCPDATICAAVMSALYSTVSEEVVLNRQLMV
ncbi:hypothetical protein Patl1_33740 [Pistacia atlantica]|uniref:Uncharacterized protein n=1 Tax=Pistacia atlantica TaxID=434234 RepID=A0ACC0ZR27_9ROSI|nr:hypothetical protein Patl1_33740 [Pistacia atlantica]